MKKRAGRNSSNNVFGDWVIKFSMPENGNMTLFLITQTGIYNKVN